MLTYLKRINKVPCSIEITQCVKRPKGMLVAFTINKLDKEMFRKIVEEWVCW